MKRKRKPRFLQLLEILVIYALMFAVVLSVGRSVLYGGKNSTVRILEEGELTGTVVPENAGTILIWDKDSTGKEGRREMSAILSQMRIPYKERKVSDFAVSDLDGKKIAVLSVTDLSTLGSRLTSLLDWVMEGHSLLVLYPPYNEETFMSVAPHFGITSMGNSLAYVEGLHFTSNLMPGCSRDLSISDPYRSSLDVTLDDDCEVFLESAGSSDTPLIWRRALGSGITVRPIRFWRMTASGRSSTVPPFTSMIFRPLFRRETASSSSTITGWTSRTSIPTTGGKMSIISPKNIISAIQVL